MSMLLAPVRNGAGRSGDRRGDRQESAQPAAEPEPARAAGGTAA